MLILNPRRVTFAGTQWNDVTLVAIDRAATRLAVGYSDNGPHPTFADAPEQRTTVRVVMDASSGLVAPRPGDAGTLSLTTSPTASDAAAQTLTASCVVTRVSHELGLKHTPTRTIEFIALSTNGAADPITIS
jgi:hypothetical protein